MARVQDKKKALDLRKKGKSYSEIKALLGISKSTLSGWLASYPLSPEKIRELRDWNVRRIENFRTTFQKKREDRLYKVYEKVGNEIRELNKREMLIAGLFLYWGEGSKTNRSSISLTNTNPSMLKFFIKWLTEYLGVDKKKLKISLHLYSDMNINLSMKYWSKELGLPLSQFRRPYIKKTLSSSITYKNGFGKGTCSVILDCQDIAEPVLMGIKYLQNLYSV